MNPVTLQKTPFLNEKRLNELEKNVTNGNLDYQVNKSDVIVYGEGDRK